MKIGLFIGLLFICFGLVDAIHGSHILFGYIEFILGCICAAIRERS
jgi:hypothetical protein